MAYSLFIFSTLLIFLRFASCLPDYSSQDKFCTCGKFAYPKKPFIAVWNSPSGGCMVNFSVPINLHPWGILAEPLQRWNSRYVTVFYGAQLGLYPYYPSEDDSNNYNGGLPQIVNLQEHLEKSKMDIMSRIPDPNYNGLAVIDWEPWRPLWERNWNAKKIYKIKSVELVRKRHPDWSMTDLVLEAKEEFEAAAKAMFVETIKLGKKLRPRALWGFYGFPDCFGQEKYDFQCTEEVKRSNDKIDWLFSESTALFPSIYLLKSHLENPEYVKGRLRESFRVTLRLSQRYGKDVLPVFPYFRSIYMDDPLQFNFLDRKDLYNTIGVASQMGSSGVVIWGNRNDENTSPNVCHRIDTYIQNTLGPSIVDIRNEVEKCSKSLCYGKGHCVHKAHLDDDLRRLYTHRNAMKRNCAQPTFKEQLKRGSVLNALKLSQNVSAITSNDSFLRSSFGGKDASDNLNKLQVDLKGQLKTKEAPQNSTRKIVDQKSQVPVPEKRFSGSFIGNHLKHSKGSLLPHMYVLIIGVSIAGAFLFSLIFIALYYYLNMNPHEKQKNQKEAKNAKKGSETDEELKTGPQMYKDYEESDIEVDLDSLKSFK